MPAKILIVAYGNPLRSDDGVAWHAADLLEQKLAGSQIEILRLHQLGPELSETLSHSATTIFIDAAAADGRTVAGEIRVEELTPLENPDASRFTHMLSPHTVVAMAATLYGAKPQACLVTVTGMSFDHGRALSPSVETALPKLVSEVVRLVEQSSGNL